MNRCVPLRCGPEPSAWKLTPSWPVVAQLRTGACSPWAGITNLESGLAPPHPQTRPATWSNSNVLAHRSLSAAAPAGGAAFYNLHSTNID